MIATGNTEREVHTSGRLLRELNGAWHERALWLFGLIIVLHWMEHIVQAYQIWILGWARPDARGVAGQAFPWLVRSEALHFGFAVVMLLGLLVLRPAFVGRARPWWTAALVIQAWHLVEHSLLQLQVALGRTFFGSEVPTSLIQVWFPRVELHLFYNLVVSIPMVVAVLAHTHPPAGEVATCTCGTSRAA